MDTISVAQKLRSLLVAHDNAQREIQSLDCLLRRLSERVTEQAVLGGRVAGGMKALERAGVVRAVKQMFEMYRARKWQQVQALVHIALASLGQHAGDETGGEEPGEDPPHSHEVMVIAEAMSLDFCQLNRFG